jgi:transposase-like protein
MKNNTDTSALSLLANEVGYDPIEDRLRENIRATIEAVFEEELDAFLGRCRYDRGTGKPTGYRNGHRERQLIRCPAGHRVAMAREGARLGPRR